MILNNGTKHTHTSSKIHHFLMDQRTRWRNKMLLSGTYTFHSYIYFFRIPFNVQNQHFLIWHVAVTVANYVTTPQTASIAILKVSALTLYTLKSVCIFSILFSRHFLRCWHGELIFDSRMIWWGEIRCQLFLVVTRLNSGQSTLQFR